MREILFRGVSKESGKMVFGFLSVSKMGNYKIIYQFEDYKWNDEDVIPETVGEFTGLLDKNGVKIFEGDIVIYWNGKGVVERGFFELSQNNGFPCWCVAKYAINGKKRTGRYKPIRVDHEVIGNRWDNPELLEEPK